MKTLKQLREKTLTSAEKKKREEIAKAIEKDNPDMPMDKKMAIATATAKRVAEGFTPKEIKMAIGVASDKRYAGGNYSGAVKAIEKIKKGLSKNSQVAAVLRRQNESTKLEVEMVSEAVGKDIAAKMMKSKTMKAFAPKVAKMKNVSADDLEKMLPDYVPGAEIRKLFEESVNEAVDYFKVAKAFDDYAKKYGGIDKSSFMKVGQFVRQLGKESDVNKQDKTFMAMKKFIGAMDTDPRDGVIQILQKHGMWKGGRIMREYGGPKISRDEYIKKGKEYHAQKEGVDFFALREKKDSYPLYHKTYSDAMAAAYAYAKKKGYEVDPDDIDRKVATGPRKPSNGKTNSFTLKLKDEKRKMLAVQVTNLDNKRYELNTYIT